MNGGYLHRLDLATAEVGAHPHHAGRGPRHRGPAVQGREGQRGARRPLAERGPRRVRGPRRGLHRARQGRRRAQPHGDAGRARDGAHLVAGRQVDRLPVRRHRRVRDLRAAAGRRRGAAADHGRRRVAARRRCGARTRRSSPSAIASSACASSTSPPARSPTWTRAPARTSTSTAGRRTAAGSPTRRATTRASPASPSTRSTASRPSPLGDGLTPDSSPVFSADGKYLFFLSNRDFNLTFSAFEFNYLYTGATRIYAAALTPDVPRAVPAEERRGEGQGAEEKPAERQGADSRRRASPTPPPPRAGRRWWPTASSTARWPCPASRRAAIARWPRRPTPSSTSRPATATTTRRRCCASTSRSGRKRRSSTASSNYVLSRDGKKLLYRVKDDWFLGRRQGRPQGRRGEGRPRGPQGEGGLARGMGADVRGRLAHRPRLVLRPEHARGGLGGDEEALRRAGALRGPPLRPRLPLRRDARRAGGGAHLRGLRRRAEGPARARRHAGRGAGGGSVRPLSHRADLPGRELGRRLPLAAHRDGRAREGGQLPARHRRPRPRAPPTTRTGCSRTRPTSRWC